MSTVRSRVLAVSVATILVAGIALATPGMAAQQPRTHDLSGTESAAGHTVSWAISGARAVPSARTDLEAYPYDGVVYQGSTLKLSGSESFTLGANLVTNLDMVASIGWLMGAKNKVTLRKTVNAGTYTLPFSFTMKMPAAAAVATANAPVVDTLAINVSSRNCNDDGVCDGPQVIMYLALLKGSAPVNAIPPHVKIFPHSGIIARGKRIPVQFLGIAFDKPNKVRMYAELYSGGTHVASLAYPVYLKSDVKASLSWPASVGGTGPFYECVWARDSGGRKSPGAPKSACAWIAREVPIAKVSNGCGTDAFGSVAEWIQNALGDRRVYGKFTVAIKPACDAHDAGYLGATIDDGFIGHLVDFRTWTRLSIDKKFLSDIRSICRKTLTSTAARKYLTTCLNGISLQTLEAAPSVGGGVAGALPQIGGLTYYETVRAYGGVGYDWDASSSGTQHVMALHTMPAGGGRNGA